MGRVDGGERSRSGEPWHFLQGVWGLCKEALEIEGSRKGRELGWNGGQHGGQGHWLCPHISLHSLMVHSVIYKTGIPAPRVR